MPRGTLDNYSAPCLPMHEILEGAPRHIDFFSIDVEQHYKALLTTLPWDTMTIDVILLECDDTDWCRRFLKDRGYAVADSTLMGDLLAVRKSCLLSATTSFA
eukprot:EG_transcript_29182